MFRITLFSLLLVCSVIAQAQIKVADKIIGQVGTNIILQNDLMEIIQQEQRDGRAVDTCEEVFRLLSQQVLIEQASRDSVTVSEDEIEANLDNRIRYFIQMYGSREAFEEASGGRSAYQLKEEFRDNFRNNAVASRMQSTLMEGVKITPQEVDTFFKALPADSLMPFPAMVEMGQIVIKPKVDAEVELIAKEKLEGIRKDIVENGKSFSSMAAMYSQDGTKDNGGEFEFTRKEVDPTFLSAAFRLQPGEISPVIRSKFGYHIIQMIRRVGDDARVRHILIAPEVTTADLNIALKKLDSVRADLVSGKISFSDAVAKYSTDENSKMTGGMIVDEMQSSRIAIEKLDASMASAVADLKVGEYAQPQIFVDDERTNSRSTRIIFMKNKIEPHILNMKDDYAVIQKAALAVKQNKYLEKWLNEHIKTFYIKIAPEYSHCEKLKSWSNNN
jgi:peptidyl-prolyl cis-trans isomerase SurA